MKSIGNDNVFYMLDLTQLQTFVEVVERGTITDAANALAYTGPAVSQQISKLERQLGGPLFDRVGGRLRPNDRGIALRPLAQQMLDLAEHTSLTVGSTEPTNHLVIAGFASAIQTLVVPMLRSTNLANLSIEVRESEDDAALRDLGLGHIDIAIVQEYDGVTGVRNDRHTYTNLVRDRLRLVAPKHHPKSVTLHDLAKSGWVTNGSGTRCEQATNAVLVNAGIDPVIRGHVADNHTLLALVRAGHGSTIVPELVLADAPKGLTIATQDLRVKRTIVGVTRKATTKQHNPVLRLLAGYAKAAVLAATR
jgi:DNA-binding transcriptional LysR family regulator